MDDNFLWPEKTHGRPRLFNLLSSHVLPELKTKNGVLDVRAFAERIGRTHEGVYLWLRHDKFILRNIDLILGASTDKLTRRMLMPYAS